MFWASGLWARISSVLWTGMALIVLVQLAVHFTAEMPMICRTVAIAALIPTTLPSRSTSGPPELPGLMDASVWRKSS